MMAGEFPVYIDIDGTLTDHPEFAMGKPLPLRISKVKDMINNNVPIVIWSAGGTIYAQDFCAENGLYPMIAIGKPHRCIDDNPLLKKNGLKILPDTWLDKK